MWSVVDDEPTEDGIPEAEPPVAKSTPNATESSETRRENPPQNQDVRDAVHENDPNRTDTKQRRNATEHDGNISVRDFSMVKVTGIVMGVVILAVLAGFAFGAKFVKDGNIIRLQRGREHTRQRRGDNDR